MILRDCPGDNEVSIDGRLDVGGFQYERNSRVYVAVM